MHKILELLEKDNRISEDQIAVMTGKSPAEVHEAIVKYEAEGIILGYNTLIDWDKAGKDMITALIEVKVTPQRGEGFDKISERIARYPQVKGCYLMSGGFDLTVIIEGRTMKEVALFVAEKLATLDSVLSTATHFVLKKYKDKGIVFEKKPEDDREAIIL